MSGAEGISIRRMRESDYDDLVRLWQRSGLKHHPEGRDSRERVLAEMAAPMAIFLVAEEGGAMVGSVMGTTDGRKGWVNRLAVLPEWRRRMVAMALLAEVERRFDERGILVWCALIQEDNGPSRRLFEGRGYEIDRTVVYYSKRKGPDV